MKSEDLNKIKCYAPSSREELMEYAFAQNAILVAVNAEKILKANDQMKEIINRNIGYPDGVGAVWALEKKGVKNSLKIPGCELWLDIVKQYKDQKSFYLVGGKEEVIQQTVDKLKREFPSIQIKGFRNGYISSDEEKEQLIEEIATKKPDVVFVAMGSPKQELLMEEMQSVHPALYQGLGGSFDVYTGNIQRAPKWWINNNLEWAYRLAKQPTRIKRQVVYLEFFVRLKMNKL